MLPDLCRKRADYSFNWRIWTLSYIVVLDFAVCFGTFRDRKRLFKTSIFNTTMYLAANRWKFVVFSRSTWHRFLRPFNGYLLIWDRCKWNGCLPSSWKQAGRMPNCIGHPYFHTPIPAPPRSPDCRSCPDTIGLMSYSYPRSRRTRLRWEIRQ